MQVLTHSRPRAGLRETPLLENQRQKAQLTCILRRRLHARASVASRSLSAFKDEFFNRDDELAALDNRFDFKPYSILLLSGPTSSGKTVSSLKKSS